ncbi:hypothetical protein CERSUDRAFT_117851 [Gelatoporia subvermispora B]|uniref:Extracellular membrane protein CFEM domain-containing protein n=1 Tax=Ceriporiopsis subvermispora (strain B) TaxID=914234 RepID=M2QA27_CERS8|nr:hypothetical protein CERSUDRAFT_117851 [Gelatoporia subvermispora B]
MRHASFLTIILLAGAYAGAESMFAQNGTCPDGLSALNNQDGESPCQVKDAVLKPCQSGFYPISHCACNLIAYNLACACNFCTPGDQTDWPTWVKNNSCPSNETNPNPSLPSNYSLQGVNIPGWAKTGLNADHEFDLPAALSVASKHSWSSLQVIIPVVVGISVALIAAALFFFFHLRKKRAWRDRLFGPFGAKRVRRAPRRKDSNWEIDDDEAWISAQDISMASLSNSSGRTRVSQVDEDGDEADDERPPVSHARSGSASSLLSSLPRPRPRRAAPGPVSSFLDRLSRYKSGVRKSPEYRSVLVKRRTLDDRWNIDSAAPTRSSTMEAGVDPTAAGGSGSQGMREGVSRAGAESPEEGQVAAVPVGESSVLLISRVPGEDFTILDSELGSSPLPSPSAATHTFIEPSTPPPQYNNLTPRGSPRPQRGLEPWQAPPLPSISSVSPIVLPPTLPD